MTDENKKVRRIMKSWMGLSTDDSFKAWRKCVKVKKKRNRREERAKLREERLRYEDQVAKYELSKVEVNVSLRFFLIVRHT